MPGEKFRDQKEKPSFKCVNQGKSCKWPNLENNVSEWGTKNRNEGCAISRGTIQFFALKKAKKLGIPKFVAST